jgi:transcriptional regulator with XRE-family HTH domain
MLQSLLNDKMKKRNMSARQVAEEINNQIGEMSHTTILRAQKGEYVDIETLIKLSEWLGVIPSTLLNSMASTSRGLADKIAAVLERAPSLTREFGRAADLIIKEKISPDILEDIAAYAAYRINLAVSPHGR